MDNQPKITDDMSEDGLKTFLQLYDEAIAKVPANVDGHGVAYFLAIKAAVLAGDVYVAQYGWEIGMCLFAIALRAAQGGFLQYMAETGHAVNVSNVTVEDKPAPSNN